MAEAGRTEVVSAGGVTDSQLAVLFRQVQWALDDAAYDWPAGRVTTRQREELAGALDCLARIVRASTAWSSTHSPDDPGRPPVQPS